MVGCSVCTLWLLGYKGKRRNRNGQMRRKGGRLALELLCSPGQASRLCFTVLVSSAYPRSCHCLTVKHRKGSGSMPSILGEYQVSLLYWAPTLKKKKKKKTDGLMVSSLFRNLIVLEHGRWSL